MEQIRRRRTTPAAKPVRTSYHRRDQGRPTRKGRGDGTWPRPTGWRSRRTPPVRRPTPLALTGLVPPGQHHLAEPPHGPVCVGAPASHRDTPVKTAAGPPGSVLATARARETLSKGSPATTSGHAWPRPAWLTVKGPQGKKLGRFLPHDPQAKRPATTHHQSRARSSSLGAFPPAHTRSGRHGQPQARRGSSDRRRSTTLRELCWLAMDVPASPAPGGKEGNRNRHDAPVHMLLVQWVAFLS